MHSLSFVLSLSATSLGAVQVSQSQTPAAIYAALVKEYEEANAAWQKSGNGLRPTDPGYADHYAKWPAFAFARRFIEFSESHPGDGVAVDALLKVVENMRTSWAADKALFSHVVRARTLLIDDHLLDERVIRAFLSPPFSAGLPGAEGYYRALLTRSRDRDLLGRACMALVASNVARARLAARPYFEHPDDHPEFRMFTDFIIGRLDPDYVGYVKATDPVPLSAESETLLNRVVDEFGDIPLSPHWAKPDARGRTLADVAKPKLLALRSVAEGSVAPEIEGEDIDGKPMKLSDYRGKVVMLVFWGAWCGPCMRSIPTVKAIADRHKDRPFVLLGINSDSGREKVKSTMAEKGIAWRSWFDGGRPDGPIATRWDVFAWPTIIILDKSGIIRFKNLPHLVSKPTDDALDSLLESTGP